MCKFLIYLVTRKAVGENNWVAEKLRFKNRVTSRLCERKRQDD
jgi:hypothetical protein